jgi:nucleotide-binding universal stress UspA family protein
MVPLDGSDYAEQALPLAQQLATEWQASLWLAQSVPQDVLTGASDVTVTPDDLRVEIQDAYQYLNQVASRQGGEVHMGVFTGRTEVALEGAVGSWAITDIVMASHGRTGLSRVILGSVADALIHQLHCPIIVIPALAAKAVEQGESRIGVPA